MHRSQPKLLQCTRRWRRSGVNIGHGWRFERGCQTIYAVRKTTTTEFDEGQVVQQNLGKSSGRLRRLLQCLENTQRFLIALLCKPEVAFAQPPSERLGTLGLSAL
ncbi:hypothetical protein D3C85_1703630 [compost metagenome]